MKIVKKARASVRVKIFKKNLNFWRNEKLLIAGETRKTKQYMSHESKINENFSSRLFSEQHCHSNKL